MRYLAIALVVLASAACRGATAARDGGTRAASQPDAGGGSGAGRVAHEGSGGRAASGHDSGVGSAAASDRDAGTQRDAGAAHASGSDASHAPDAAVTTSAPVIPAITGTCPTFSSGTIDFGGLNGVLFEVGPRGTGQGSLLFYWHGTGSTADEVDTLISAAERQRILDAGGIIVSPETSTGQGDDCALVMTWSGSDFDVADQIAACAVRDYAIDARRIYTTGCGGGGFQAACMAEVRSAYVAAVVTNNGGVPVGRPFQNEHIPPAMTMYGPLTDPIDYASTSKTFADAVKNAGGFVVDCTYDAPGCRAPSNLQSAAITFLLDHPFGVSREPYAAVLPPAFPSTCRIF
jgi:poly(3-hydroxybutyrate) depolymerase